MIDITVGETAQYKEIVGTLNGLKELRMTPADWNTHKHTLDQVGLLLLSIIAFDIIEGVEPCKRR